MDYLIRAKSFKAKKQLGQNFLIDENAINTIINEAQITKDDIIAEIGPGLGFVTEKIAEKAKKVIAVEIDKDAIKKINELPFDNIEVIEQDVLKTDFSTFSDKKIKVIANIPYYITSPILAHLLGEIYDTNNANRNSISEVFLMVQYEVAKRIVASEKSASKDYGLLSILANYWCDTEFIQKVPAKSFWPSPKVDSAIIKLTIKDTPNVIVENVELFHKVIKASFSVRRKNLKNALQNGGFGKEVIEQALSDSNIEGTRRGETLSMEEFKLLSEAIAEA